MRPSPLLPRASAVLDSPTGGGAASSHTVPTPPWLLLHAFLSCSVIWRDDEGKYHCFRDACPHRLVPLSDGRVANGRLECGYHGWQFEGCGKCVAMPQGGDPAAPRAQATAYCCAVAQGLVWVKLQAAPADGSGALLLALPCCLLPC